MEFLLTVNFSPDHHPQPSPRRDDRDRQAGEGDRHVVDHLAGRHGRLRTVHVRPRILLLAVGSRARHQR